MVASLAVASVSAGGRNNPLGRLLEEAAASETSRGPMRRSQEGAACDEYTYSWQSWACRTSPAGCTWHDSKCQPNTIVCDEDKETFICREKGCPPGSCVSQWGWCGTSGGHCNANSQAKCVLCGAEGSSSSSAEPPSESSSSAPSSSSSSSSEEPDADCVGEFAACGADCAPTAFVVSTAATGNGSCPNENQTQDCSVGMGQCLGTDCQGAFPACGADCQPVTFAVSVAATGNGACPNENQTQDCNPGMGGCLATPGDVAVPLVNWELAVAGWPENEVGDRAHLNTHNGGYDLDVANMHCMHDKYSDIISQDSPNWVDIATWKNWALDQPLHPNIPLDIELNGNTLANMGVNRYEANIAQITVEENGTKRVIEASLGFGHGIAGLKCGDCYIVKTSGTDIPDDSWIFNNADFEALIKHDRNTRYAFIRVVDVATWSVEISDPALYTLLPLTGRIDHRTQPLYQRVDCKTVMEASE